MACGQSHPGLKLKAVVPVTVWLQLDPWLIGTLATHDSSNTVHHAPRSRSNWVLQNAGFFITVSVFLRLFFSLPHFPSLDHGFCNGCMRDWLESNRVRPQRRSRQLQTPRVANLRANPTRVVCSSKSSCSTRTRNKEWLNSARDSFQAINSTSSAIQVTRAILGVQSQHVVSTSQHVQTEQVVKNVTEVFVMSFSACVRF